MSGRLRNKPYTRRGVAPRVSGEYAGASLCAVFVRPGNPSRLAEHRNREESSMTKTAILTNLTFTLPSHWKAVLGVVLGLLIGSIAWTVWASPPDCRWSWDRDSFHDRTSVGHIRWCLANNHVDINQTDRDGWTLLHRIARSRKSTPHRLALLNELVRYDDLDIDRRDYTGRTALHYAVAKLKRWPMAAVLLEAGASRDIPDEWKGARIPRTWAPVVEQAERNVRNPFEAEVDFEALTDCRSVSCWTTELLKPEVD